MSLDPAVAAVRLAVRRVLGQLDEPLVVVACSGGADSLALLSAARIEGHRLGLVVVGVTVDHGLQEGSAEHAQWVVAAMAARGADETVCVRVDVTASGQGPEAAAREARYAVLGEVARRVGSGVVLLGHTRDDQAETVLLGLTRGSGSRSLAGMRPRFEVFHRPLLDVTRAQTEAACRAERIDFWSDPHNEDPRFTRSRVRHRVLPVLEAELGPGVAAALARTADQLREDSHALDEIAGRVKQDVTRDGALDTGGLEAHPAAVLRRVLRLAALAAGCPPSELFRVHLLALSGMVEGPESAVRHKQVQLPGHVTAYRDGDLLRFRPTAVAG
ncbi:MAG: tRNA lysidine(34) synthetase TilS [Nocardioidaceae bacterium]